VSVQKLGGAGGRCTDGPGPPFNGCSAAPAGGIPLRSTTVKWVLQGSQPRGRILTPEGPAPFLSTTAAFEQDQVEATSALKSALKGCLVQITSIGTASEFSRTWRRQA